MLDDPQPGRGEPSARRVLPFLLRPAPGLFDTEETPRVTDRTSSVSGVAERYASALFDLARADSAIDRIEGELQGLSEAIDASAELRRLVQSPVFSAEEQERAIGAIGDRLGIAGLGANFLRLVARNRRLFALRPMIQAFRAMAARHRGEVTAEVTSAHPLSSEQVEALKAALKEKLGRDVTLESRVNPALLGGLVVKVGSRMIDTSLRTRLMTVKTRLKEVG
jgi:F-type H+-transporting ATPase subunit delta